MTKIAMSQIACYASLVTICATLLLASTAEARFRRKEYSIGLRFGGGPKYRVEKTEAEQEVKPAAVVLEPATPEAAELIDAAEAIVSGGDKKRTDYSVPYFGHLAVIESCAGHGQPCSRGRPSGGVLGARACCPGLICASKSFSMLSGHAVCHPDNRINF